MRWNVQWTEINRGVDYAGAFKSCIQFLIHRQYNYPVSMNHLPERFFFLQNDEVLYLYTL